MHVNINASKTRTIIDFTKSNFNELVVLGKYNYNKTEDILENHVHSQMIEICYSDKGSQWFVVEKQRYLVKGGDIFIHYPNELHGSGGHPEEKGCLYWFIIKVPEKSKAKTTMSFLINQLIVMNRRHFRGEGDYKKNAGRNFQSQPLGGRVAANVANKNKSVISAFFIKTD